MADVLTPEQTKSVLLVASQAIVDAKDDLCAADRVIGDGDHGIGMARGFGAAVTALQEASVATVGDAFKEVGTAVMATSGGASGVVFGTMFRAPAKGLAADVLDGEGYAAALATAAEKVQSRGKTGPGQKTMLDALIPAAEAARAAAASGLVAAARAAADAAKLGSDATKDMVAQVGKAKSLGDRSLGYPDPGSISVTILLTAIADEIEKALA